MIYLPPLFIPHTSIPRLPLLPPLVTPHPPLPAQTGHRSTWKGEMLSSRCQSLPSVVCERSQWQAPRAFSCDDVSTPLFAQFARRCRSVQALQSSAASAIMSNSVNESEALRRLTCTWSMSSACLQSSDEVNISLLSSLFCYLSILFLLFLSLFISLRYHSLFSFSLGYRLNL